MSIICHFIFKMDQGGMVTKVQIKKELESLSKNLFNLDL